MPERGEGEWPGKWACCRGILGAEVCTENGWMPAARDRSHGDFSVGFLLLLLLPETPRAVLKRQHCVRHCHHRPARDGPIRRGWL